MIRRVIRGGELEGYPEGNLITYNPERTSDLDDATIITSEVEYHDLIYPFNDGSKTYHAPVLDLDIGAVLIPSTTPGHYHLYIEKLIEEDKYFALLDALADADIIERGYAEASKARGYTAVRLPWVAKP